MDKSTVVTARKMVLFSALSQALVLGFGLIIPKMIIEGIGSDENGILSTLKFVVAFGLMVFNGLGEAIKFKYYNVQAKSRVEIERIYTASKRLYKKYGILVSLITLVIVIVLTPQINLVSSPLETLFLSVVTVGITMIEFIKVSPLRIYFQAQAKQHIVSQVQSIASIVVALISFIVIYFGGSILAVLLVSLISVFTRWLLFVRRSDIKIYKKEIQANVTIRSQWSAIAYQALAVSMDYLPALTVFYLFGPTDASIFSIYHLVYYTVFTGIGVFSSGFTAILAAWVQSEDSRRLYSERVEKYRTLYVVISSIMFVTASSSLSGFISLYLPGEKGIYVSENYIILYGLGLFIRSLRMPHRMLIDATGKFKENIAYGILEVISFFLAIGYLVVSGNLTMTTFLLSFLFSQVLRQVYFEFFSMSKLKMLSNKKTLLFYVLAISLIIISNLVEAIKIKPMYWIDLCELGVVNLLISILLFGLFTYILHGKKYIKSYFNLISR